ncbi:MAG TPA: hypothetical protein VFW96_17920 [Thermomicrobiales bacterium]|nr:hypothetical protein [Thermomicrobiales bacterium]
MSDLRRLLERAKNAYIIASFGIILTLAFWVVGAHASPGAGEDTAANAGAPPAASPAPRDTPASGVTLAAHALLANLALPGDDGTLTANDASPSPSPSPSPGASPSPGPGFTQSNACDQKHPTVGHDTVDGTPGTPGHHNPACFASPAPHAAPAASPAPSPSPAPNNRCDQQHPDQGNDANGHHNPACAAPSTTSPAPSPAPGHNAAPATHGQPGNDADNDDQDGDGGGHGHGNQGQPHGQGDNGNHDNGGHGNNGKGGGKKKP